MEEKQEEKAQLSPDEKMEKCIAPIKQESLFSLIILNLYFKITRNINEKVSYSICKGEGGEGGGWK